VGVSQLIFCEGYPVCFLLSLAGLAFAESPKEATLVFLRKWGENYRKLLLSGQIGTQQQERHQDLLIWDNRRVMHRRNAFPPESRRIMHRTQIKGSGAPRRAAV